ncbi:MAG: helix-turn-helix domain-containing protein [Lactobacillales bacterium]|nr:helix-turn-helix domain-containing protein [Lactobacillales bacterium]
MIFDELMFGQSDQLKIELYRTLSGMPVGEYRAEVLIDKHLLNYHQVTNILRQIDADLLKADSKHQPILVKSGKIMIHKSLPNMDKYRSLLLGNSLPFKFLLEILNNPKSTAEEFCAREDIGRSTLARKLSPLISYLRHYKLSFSYSPLMLNGNETVIRFFLFHCFWLGLRDNVWPFALKKEDIAEVYEHLYSYIDVTGNYVFGEEMKWLIAISKMRYEKGFIVDKHEPVIQFFRENPHYKMEDFDMSWFATEEDREREASFWFIYSMWIDIKEAPNSLSARDTKAQLLKTPAFQEPIRFARAFFDYVKGERLVPEMSHEDENELFYDLLHETFRFYYLGGVPTGFESLTGRVFENSRGYEDVKEKIGEFYDAEAKLYPFIYRSVSRGIFELRFVNLIYPLYVQTGHFMDNLVVGLALELDYHLLVRLRIWLNHIKNITVKEFEPDYSQDFDIVVHSSSRFQELYPNIPHFQWEPDYGNEEMLRLYHDIHMMYSKKVFEETK